MRIFVIALILFTQALFADPFDDPFFSTATSALLNDRGSGKRLDLEVLPDRNQIPTLEGRGILQTRFYLNRDKSAPLIFLIPGTGAPADASYAKYLGEFLSQHGFHVLSIPSPLHWNFALAAHPYSFPGYTAQDAIEIYNIFQLARESLKENGAEPKSFSLLGISLGALEAAFVNELDRSEGVFNFRRVVLINPPIDLAYSFNQIRKLTQLKSTLSSSQLRTAGAKAYRAYRLAFNKELADPEAFLGLQAEVKFTPAELKYLVGSYMQGVVGDLVDVLDQVFHLAVLKTPRSIWRLNAREAEAQTWDWFDYLSRIGLPQVRREFLVGWSLAGWNERASLTAVTDSLASDNRVYLIHNQDDFLVDKAQLQGLREIFGGRAQVYPQGGHIGNLWRPEYKRHLLSLFLRY